MDAPSAYMQKPRQRGPPVNQDSQLFQDTSQPPTQNMYGGGNMPPQDGFMQPGSNFPGSNLLNDPMVTNMALQYGQSLAGQGKEMFEKNMDKYISASKLKYYFAVDTAYVGKKIALLFFPFTHKEWSVKFHQEGPVAPRFDVNAPDLYIPVMAYVTYILLIGITLGLNEKFSPEELGIQASSALVWLAIEVAIIMFSLYLVSAKTDLSTWDVIAYSGYKYVGMIVIIAGGMFFPSLGYWLTLAYTSFTVTYFLLKTLRLKILSNSSADGSGHGGARKMYLTFFIALMQPLFMYWLTRHLPSHVRGN